MDAQHTWLPCHYCVHSASAYFHTKALFGPDSSFFMSGVCCHAFIVIVKKNIFFKLAEFYSKFTSKQCCNHLSLQLINK